MALFDSVNTQVGDIAAGGDNSGALFAGRLRHDPECFRNSDYLGRRHDRCDIYAPRDQERI